MAGTTIYRTTLLPEWIDYNQHLRDAYYGVIISLATDALMDQVGIDADYRQRTQCTLYSLEMHIHWLKEVKADATLAVDAIVLGVDSKRLHLGVDIRTDDSVAPVATAELMLLHYRQGDTPGATPFPDDIRAAIETLRLAYDGGAWPGPRARPLAMTRR